MPAASILPARTTRQHCSPMAGCCSQAVAALFRAWNSTTRPWEVGLIPAVLILPASHRRQRRCPMARCWPPAVKGPVFVVALFIKGFGHGLLLEAGVFLISVKLIM